MFHLALILAAPVLASQQAHPTALPRDEAIAEVTRLRQAGTLTLRFIYPGLTLNTSYGEPHTISFTDQRVPFKAWTYWAEGTTIEWRNGGAKHTFVKPTTMKDAEGRIVWRTYNHEDGRLSQYSQNFTLTPVAEAASQDTEGNRSRVRQDIMHQVADDIATMSFEELNSYREYVARVKPEGMHLRVPLGARQNSRKPESPEARFAELESRVARIAELESERHCNLIKMQHLTQHLTQKGSIDQKHLEEARRQCSEMETMNNVLEGQLQETRKLARQLQEPLQKQRVGGSSSSYPSQSNPEPGSTEPCAFDERPESC